jgi:hypothetical protein
MLRPAFAIFAQQYLSTLLGNFGMVYLNEPIPRNPKLRIFKHPSRFNWGTEYLKAVTANNNRVMISPEVIGEAELVDVLFEPNMEKSRASLGLLGKLVSVPCIIEIQRWAPNDWDLRTYLRHWLTWKAENNGSIIAVDETPVDTDEQSNTSQELRDEQVENVDKTMLIIVPSIAPQYLQGFAGQASGINIPGVYELPPVFCTTIIATNELPQDASTLWLRILGRGRTQREAITELFALDANYQHRTATLQQLQQWYRFLSSGKLGKESARLMATLAMIDGLSEEQM